MFKTFDSSKISTSTQVKASVQRAIRSQVQEAHPKITDDQLDAIVASLNADFPVEAAAEGVPYTV